MTRTQRTAQLQENGRTSGLELRHLRVFVTLVDHGSMTTAAQVLGVAQSTVSEALAALERAIGTPALTRRRGAHAIALTPAGRALLPHARGVLSAVENAQAAVASATREVRATVDVIANESVSTYLLPRALAVLRQRWPNTRFAVTVGTCPIVREGLADGRFDIGLLLRAQGGKPGVPAAPTSGVVVGAALPLADVPLVLFSGPAHPLALRTLVQVPRDRLAQCPVFLSDASGDFHALLCAFFSADGLPGPRLESTGSIEAVKRSVVTNPLALGVLPAYALAEELRSGLVRVVPVRPGLPRVRLEALLSEARPPRPAAAELIDVLRTALRPRPPDSSSGEGRPKTL